MTTLLIDTLVHAVEIAQTAANIDDVSCGVWLYQNDDPDADPNIVGKYKIGRAGEQQAEYWIWVGQVDPIH